MAVACTPSALVSASNCIECGMTHKQLLAALVYIQCTANGMSCTPSSLVSASTQIRESMTEKQLLAALVYTQCTATGGGSGGGAVVLSGPADPVADPGVPNAVYKNTTTGNLWFWSSGAWA